MGITEKDVHGACDQINEGGDKPTHRLVRGLLGTGSFTTIVRHMETWSPKPTDNKDASPPPAEVTANVSRMAQDLWCLALTEAQRMAGEQIAAARQETEQAVQRGDKIAEAADAYVAENDAWRAAMEDLKQKLDAASAGTNERDLRIAALEMAVKAKDAELERVHALLATRSPAAAENSKPSKPKKKPAPKSEAETASESPPPDPRQMSMLETA